MPAIDGEFRVIDRFLRNLEARLARTQKTVAASPIEFHFRFAGASYEVCQIEAKEVVAFDHIGNAFFDDGRQSLERRFFRFLDLRGIDDD